MLEIMMESHFADSGAADDDRRSEERISIEATDEIYRLLQFRRYEWQIARAVSHFQNAGIEFILIKGWAAARAYSQPYERRLGDIDLAVAPEDFAAAWHLINGGNPDLSEIDLHEGLRHLDTVEWEMLFAAAEQVECAGARIRILCAEDHLRVLCVHWLTDGGIDREKLRDIYFAVKNRSAEFDWQRCLNTVSLTRRRWTICVIGLAHKYLGLEIADLPFADEALQLPKWLTNAVEKEWRSRTKFTYLHYAARNTGDFIRQLGKRFPPNPIRATVECEGEFDERSRVFYQIRDTLRRVKPSLERLWHFYTQRNQER